MTDKRSLTLRLPWPPSLNRIWRAVGGRTILSKSARAYKVQAANALPAGRVVPLTGRLIVTCLACPPRALRNQVHDVMNREKLLCDTLTEQRVWLDDSQIDVFLIGRGPESEHGHVDILVSEY